MSELQGDLGKYLSGMPVTVAGANVAISQPSIKDICAFGEDSFLMSIELFVKAKELAAEMKNVGKSQLGYIDDFQILLVIIQQDENTKRNVDNLFGLIFPNYIIEYDAGCINFRVQENGPIVGQLNPMNFENFRITLKELFLPVGTDKYEEEFNPANDAAAEIAAKLQRGREIRNQIKSDKDKKKANSIFGNYASALSIGLAIDINVIYNYTPFQLFDSIKRYTIKMAYDLYQKVATTPMMDVSKMDEPDNWMDGIY